MIQISITQNRVICIKNINDSYKTNRIRVRAFMLGLSLATPVLLKLISKKKHNYFDTKVKI